jgi:dienelactone hydrolase
MNAALKPARLPDALYKVAGYFLPRLMFLQTKQGPQTHWGDVAVALQDFPEDLLDLSSGAFWQEWMLRWSRLGDDYSATARASATPAGARRAWRSAAACYHWAEFMYFDDAAAKTRLRQSVKACFLRGIDRDELQLTTGEMLHDGVRIPYYLALPQGYKKGDAPLPCVVLSNGLDSVTEVEVYAFAEQFLERGMAVFMFDGPGQGINVGCNPVPLKFEQIGERIVAHLHMEPAIDSSQLGFFGVSFGGYLALRVARHLGAHFKGVVNLSGGPAIAPFAGLPRRLKEDFRFAFMCEGELEMQKRFDALAIDEVFALQTDLLSVHGARDDIFPLAPLAGLQQVQGARHELIVYPGEAHVCLNYINQYTTRIADWMAQRLVAGTERTALAA